MSKQKTKAQIAQELDEAQKRIAELEQAAHSKPNTMPKSGDQARCEDEPLYRTFIEQSHDGIIILDEQGTICVWNSAQESITGIPQGEAIGQKYWDVQYRVLKPETRARITAENIKAALQNTFTNGEYPSIGTLQDVEIQSVDGSRKFIQISPFSVKTTNGYRIGSITRDVTEQKRIVNAMHENEERFSRVFHVSPAQMAITNLSNGKYIDVNETFLKTLGFTREEVIGKTATELNLFFDPNQRTALLEKMNSQGYLREEDVQVQTKSGDVRHGVFSAEYIQVQERRFLLTVMNDVTERKQVEEDLGETRKRLIEAQELAHIGNWEWDLKNNALIWSDEVYKIFGVTPNEFNPTVESFESYIHPEDKVDFLQQREKMLIEKQFASIDHRIIRPDGQIRYVQERTQINLDANGNLTHIIGTVQDITERKLTEEERRESDDRYRLLFETMLQGVVFQNCKGEIIHANATAEKILGLTLDQMQGNTAVLPQWKSIREDGSDFPVEEYPPMMVLKTGKPIYNTIMGIHNPVLDTYHWININSVPRFNDDTNKPYQVFSTFEDITERRKAEKNILESEERYRLLAENISDVIWILDIESFRYSYVSPSVLQLRGYSAEEVLAQDVSASLTSASGQYLAKVMPERLIEFEQGIIKAYTDEVEQPCKDGTAIWTESTTRFVRSPETGKLEVYGVSRNITDRKNAEAAIHRIEKRNTVLIEHAPDGIALVDDNGVFMFASPSAYRMFGYAVEEIIGRQSRDKVHPDDLYLLADLRGKLASSPETSHTVEYRFRHKNGSYLWLESTYTSMFNEPSVQGIVINFRNMTDRKLVAEITRQQSEQLRLLYEASQQLNRTLDVKEIYQTICDFMAIIAPSDTLFISAFDLETQLITCNAYWMSGTWLDVTPFPTIPLEEEGKGTQSRVIRSGQAMLLNDYQEFLKTSQNIYYVEDETNEVTNEGPEEDDEDVTRSAMIVPLKSGGAVKGIIQVSSYHKDAYTEDQLKLLEALALHIASAEQNALLYTQLVGELNERKQVEEALRASNETAQAMLQAIPDLMFRMDKHGVFLDYKADASELYTQAPNLPLIGKRTRDVSPVEFADLIEKEIEKTLETGALQSFEYKLEIPASGMCDYEARMIPSGKDEVLAIVRDITEQNKAQKALRASEEKYRVLIKSLDNVVASLDYDGKFLYMNDMASAQMGGVAEQLIGKTMYDLFPEQIASKQMDSIQTVIREDKGRITEDISMIAGKPRWYRTSIQPIHDEDGQVIQVLINSTDIHNLKMAQQELQELNRTLEERVEQRAAEVQDLYDNSPSGYHSLDVNGNFTLINETEVKWLGYSREEIIGQSILNFLSPASVFIFKDNFPAFKQNGWLKDLELEFIRKDGSIFPILVNAVAIYDERGKYLMSRSTVLDNTNQKEAAETMRNANLEMARAMRMKDEFLASMSHELRTPLNGILGLSEALQLDVYGPMTEKQKSTLAHVENSGRHLLELINDILDVSKIEAGKFELEIAPTSLGDICQSSIQLTKGMANKKRQNVHFTMNPASITVNADGRRLKQVLVNLLSNAVKFTPENGSLGLEVTQNEADRIVYISVWDRGIGISNEDIKKLFQPFVQLDSSLSRQQTGTGLGLTLVQRLVEMHGGSIEVKSTPKEGSRFMVALPCLSADSPIDGSSDTSFHSRFRYALIIEDESMDAGHLARYCRALGINPILHSTGKDALQRAIVTRPNIVFLDIHLPDLSGWDVLTQLKAHPETKHIPVVITSVDDEKQKAASLNADGYLVKFFAVSELRSALTNLQKTPSLEKTPVTPSDQLIGTVMIVDDNEINIETVIDYLGSKNFNVVSDLSGIDFLNHVSQIRPDLVLMDIQMPEMDGLETIRRLRALTDDRLASIPVIALTALAMPGDRERCIEAGADEYVTKPFRLKELHELILQMLEGEKRKEL